MASALQYVLEMNVNLAKEEPLPKSSIYISVAVTTPAGLITPLVKDVAGKSIQEISADVKVLAGMAK